MWNLNQYWKFKVPKACTILTIYWDFIDPYVCKSKYFALVGCPSSKFRVQSCGSSRITDFLVKRSFRESQTIDSIILQLIVFGIHRHRVLCKLACSSVIIFYSFIIFVITTTSLVKRVLRISKEFWGFSLHLFLCHIYLSLTSLIGRLAYARCIK